MNLFVSSIELKFTENGADLPNGEFKGYGSVFGNTDSHGDVIAPGAFKDTLAERAAEGRPHVPMYAMHGFAGDGLPAGVWKAVGEDTKGLRTHGKISAMDTDIGKRHYGLLRDGAYGGQSIGYKTLASIQGKAAGEPKRLITKAKLYEISLVDDPSNALALNDEFKRRHPDEANTKATSGPGAASAAVAAAIKLHRACMSGGDSPTADERGRMLGHLQDAHEALTGQRMPDGVKSARTATDFAEIFRDMGIPPERADALAADAFKSAADRSGVVSTAMQQLGDVLSGFRASLG